MHSDNSSGRVASASGFKRPLSFALSLLAIGMMLGLIGRALPAEAAISGITISSISPSTTVVGQSYTVNYTLAGSAPTGNVTVSDGTNSNSCAAALSGSCSMTSFTAGSKTITATYVAESRTDTEPHTVNKADTSVAIVDNSGGFTFFGQTFTLSITVTADLPGGGTPQGTVDVIGGDGATSCNNISLNGSGQASCTLTMFIWEDPTITVHYDGNANYNSSDSIQIIHNVRRGVPSITITNSATLSSTPSVVGELVTVNWSTSFISGGGTLTGIVEVNEGIGCIADVSAGTCQITWTTPGARTLTAHYSGDDNFDAAVSSGVSHTVNQGDTVTTITNQTDLANTTFLGQPFEVQWEVEIVPPADVNITVPGATGPTGQVQVTVNGQVACFAQVDVGRCTTALGGATQAGVKSILAKYSGDANFATSTSQPVSHTILANVPTVSRITNNVELRTATVVGAPFDVDWAIDSIPTGTTLSGTVNVTLDGSTVCTSAVGSGSGTCVVTPLTADTYALKVSFDPSLGFIGSSSASVSHTVSKGQTTIAITNAAALATPSAIRQPYAVEWDVDVVAPAVGTPGGNVLVRVNGSIACSAPVATGTCNATTNQTGLKSVTATYVGDSNFSGSASAPVQHQVTNQGTTTIVISNAAALESTPSQKGVPYEVSWTITPNPAGTPTGNVRVMVGFAVGCEAPVGAGSCMVTTNSTGFKRIRVIYEGDGSYKGDTSPIVTHRIVN